ncbi:MAG: hypothetical protein ACUVX8_02270 [Candidatus Zipacnadales bacterium]
MMLTFGILLTATAAVAWNGHKVTEGELTVFVEEIPLVTERDVAIPVKVTITNSGGEVVSGTAEVRDMVDDSRVVGEAKKGFTVPATGTTSVEFAVSFGKDTYSALYPVHVYIQFISAGQPRVVHAVRIVETRFAEEDVTSDVPTAMEEIIVPRRGAIGLWTTNKQRVAWGYYDQPLRYKAAGWQGSDALSRANFNITTITRGETKSAIQMHPPWHPGGGTIFADYLLKLPNTKPLTLTFANAIRDNTAQESPSDGVLFRVWVGEGIQGANAEQPFESFTATKVWAPGPVDLSKFAGKSVLLRLESHPGPNRNTTCDSSYWAEPTVIAGEMENAEERPSLNQAAEEGNRIGKRLLADQAKPDNKLTFMLGTGDNRMVAVWTPTRRGIVDGFLTLVGPNSAVTFDGLLIEILRQPVFRGPSGISFLGYETQNQNGRTAHVHRLEMNGVELELTVTLWAEGNGLRVKIDCPERITDFSLGSADQKAPVVYYGHGYRIVNPQAFRAGFGGHNLATSHVGCDFERGLSLLQAVDVVPDYFEVNPDLNRYALHSHLNGTLTLVPSEQGAFDCAFKYRPLYDKPRASGVEKLAGRFCFDIWGGRYADVADQMAEMIRYGLTDALLTVHVWQRWGYDYRLPDVWPPLPSLGTVEDLRQLGVRCRGAGILWGLHDNYIDFYPDAEGFSYDHICFTESGQPIKAWFNESRDAQSYRWRPDRFMPFLQRNLKLIKDGVAPTHYFVDVFTSATCFDFYDREGNFHPSTETRRKWGEAFAWIREHLGENAPTTSEAGHDQLIGSLDGADCQYLQLSDKPTRFMIYAPCEDWERVPWFDVVNHSRFILHGVGYSGRYEGGRSRNAHGINSDDYISAEILTGHALMVDARSWGRPAVRKYWLAQDIARRLALQEIANVEFADGDMHRQIVTWHDGTKVYVNRGESDWAIGERILPQYGYLVEAEGLTSAIERRDGHLAESTVGPSGWYCDARTCEADPRLKIEPHVERFQHLGGRNFQWEVVWQTKTPAPRDMRVFVHFYSDTATRSDKIAFQDDHLPAIPTSKWEGEVRYSRTITVPENADGEYRVAFGLYDERGRLLLHGPPLDPGAGDAIWVGTLAVERDAEGIRKIAFVPPELKFKPDPLRTNEPGTVIDFGFAVTDGGFRVQMKEDGLTLTPLPNSPPFNVMLRLDRLGLEGRTVKQVLAIARDGREQEVKTQQTDDVVSLAHDGASFAYEIRF